MYAWTYMHVTFCTYLVSLPSWAADQGQDLILPGRDLHNQPGSYLRIQLPVRRCKQDSQGEPLLEAYMRPSYMHHAV